MRITKTNDTVLVQDTVANKHYNFTLNENLFDDIFEEEEEPEVDNKPIKKDTGRKVLTDTMDDVFSQLNDLDEKPLGTYDEEETIHPNTDAPVTTASTDTNTDTPSIDYDDDFVDPEGVPSAMADTAPTSPVEEIQSPKGPATPNQCGVAQMLMDAIKDEYDAISTYNSIIENLKIQNQEDFIPVIQDINAEEQNHVGMLTALLEKVSPNVVKQEEGKDEAVTTLQADETEATLSPDEVDDDPNSIE